MTSFFKYFEESSRVERENIAEELKELYNGAVEDEKETLSETRMNPRSHKARENYNLAVQRLGAIMDIFEILHIVDYDEELFEFIEEYQIPSAAANPRRKGKTS